MVNYGRKEVVRGTQQRGRHPNKTKTRATEAAKTEAEATKTREATTNATNPQTYILQGFLLTSASASFL